MPLHLFIEQAPSHSNQAGLGGPHVPATETGAGWQKVVFVLRALIPFKYQRDNRSQIFVEPPNSAQETLQGGLQAALPGPAFCRWGWSFNGHDRVLIMMLQMTLLPHFGNTIFRSPTRSSAFRLLGRDGCPSRLPRRYRLISSECRDVCNRQPPQLARHG